MGEQSGFCVQCGRTVSASWGYCPVCGAQCIGETPAKATLPAIGENADVIELMEARRWPEAEAMLRARLKLAPSPAGLLLLADVLFKTVRIEECGEVLDQAVALESSSPTVRLRRAQHLAKLGFYQRALADVAVAQAHISDGEVRLLVYSHELERSLQGPAKNSFVRNTTLPAWLARLTHRTPTGAPDAV